MLPISKERPVPCSRVFTIAALLVCLAVPPSAKASAEQVDRARYEAAMEALREKRQARISAGYVPKTEEEKKLVRLRANSRRHEYRQHLAATRATFEEARAEVYREIAGKFVENAVITVDAGIRTSLIEDPNTGELTTLVTRDEGVVSDPLMVAFAAHFAEKGARSAGIAAASSYRANTFYASRIENAERRIRDLEARIAAQKGGQFARVP